MLSADRDPKVFADTLLREWRLAPDPAEFVEANRESIDEARRLSPEAATALAALDSPREPEAQAGHQPGAHEVLIPVNARGAAWVPYLKALRQSLSAIGADRLAAWAADNAPAIQKAPDSYRLQAVKLVQEHAVAVGAAMPDSVASLVGAAPKDEAPPPPAEAAMSADARWQREALIMVEDAPTPDGLMGLVNGELFARRLADLHKDQPTLFAELDTAISARLAALRSGPPDDMFPGDRP